VNTFKKDERLGSKSERAATAGGSTATSGLYDRRLSTMPAASGAVDNIHASRPCNRGQCAENCGGTPTGRRDAMAIRETALAYCCRFPTSSFARRQLGFELGEARDYGVGMIFFPRTG
jgi:hypothetical protein